MAGNDGILFGYDMMENIVMENIADQLGFIEEKNSLDDLMHQADLKFQHGLFSEAEQLYQKLLIKNPGNHRVLLGIALAALEQNNVADAIQFMQQATEAAPDIPLYRRNLGELLRRVGQLEAAIFSHKIAMKHCKLLKWNPFFYNHN